ncbi:hypothetical protein GCM10027093_49940 [Paraburkholderia jirisanensis]
MKKFLLFAALTLLLSVPVSIGIARMPWLIAWFDEGSGWDVFNPVLKLMGSIGGEQDYNILFGTFLLAGFIVSMGISALLVAGASRLRNRARSTSRPE